MQRLLFRIAWPSLAASLLFAASCAAAAVYLGLRQEATVQQLEEDLRGRRIVDDLLRHLAELIEIGLRGDGSDRDRAAALDAAVPRLLDEFEAVSGPERQEMAIARRLEAAFGRYREAEGVGGGTVDRPALAILETDVRQALRDLDAQIAEETARSLAAMHRTASWTAWALAGVGIMATAAGLFFGYTVASRLERAMTRAEELSALGQMAAGMAHELRNPLTAISMLVQLQREEAEREGPPPEDLTIIEREIARMEERLDAFIDYARPSRPKWRRIDLRDVAATTLGLIQGRAAKHRVEVIYEKPAAPVSAEADAEQIGRVLVNLAMNAIDAMPRGGRLTMTLAPAADGFVEIAVDDTGPGFDPKTAPRMFEPFFTGKEAGLGLGLPISARIAREHGGRLTARNRSEGGARFLLRLPASRIAG